MIKYNSSASVLSSFNPIVALEPNIRLVVNANFIRPILVAFFSNIGGIDAFDELDTDKLITEIDFVSNIPFSSLVNQYLYKHLITDISKSADGRVVFKPKYLVTFDEDLANYDISPSTYPHATNDNIKYGVMRLGNAPVLYYVFVRLQDLIRFIKTAEVPRLLKIADKSFESDAQKFGRMYDEIIVKKQLSINTASDSQEVDELTADIERLNNIKSNGLQGNRGKLRVNLAWNTTDDLDIHVLIPNGQVINYSNKIVEYNGALGQLDVDKNASNDIVSSPQENINWNVIPQGKHTISVNFFTSREKTKVSFTISIIPDVGEGRIYNAYVESEGAYKTRQVAVFECVEGEILYQDLV